MIKPYLSDIINDHEKRKIQPTMPINFISSKDLLEKEKLAMAKSDSIKIMMGSKTNDIIEKLFESLLKYKERLEESIARSNLIFDNIGLLYYHLNRIIFKRVESYNLKN